MATKIKVEVGQIIYVFIRDRRSLGGGELVQKTVTKVGRRWYAKAWRDFRNELNAMHTIPVGVTPEKIKQARELLGLV